MRMNAARIASLAAVVAGCAPARAELGRIKCRRPDGSSSMTFVVERGRVYSEHIDVSLEGDGCLRGQREWQSDHPDSFTLCPEGARGADGHEHWRGRSGEI